MLFESIVREDRSIVNLLDADYTFVTNVWPATMASPTSMAATFGESLSMPPARAGVFSVKAVF